MANADGSWKGSGSVFKMRSKYDNRISSANALRMNVRLGCCTVKEISGTLFVKRGLQFNPKMISTKPTHHSFQTHWNPKLLM